RSSQIRLPVAEKYSWTLGISTNRSIGWLALRALGEQIAKERVGAVLHRRIGFQLRRRFGAQGVRGIRRLLQEMMLHVIAQRDNRRAVTLMVHVIFKRHAHLAGGLVAAGQVALKGLHHDRNQGVWNVWAVLLGIGNRRRLDVLQSLVDVFGFEDVMSRQQLIHHDAQRKEIGAVIGGFVT